MIKKLNFVFFGGEPLAVPTLEILYKSGFVPSLIVCNPDKPAGRNLEITPPPTKLWALEHGISILQPEKLDAEFALKLSTFKLELGIVVSYGKIIPKEFLNLGTFGLINIHPSLLPLYRGPSPIVAPILNGDTSTGVTIIKIDEEMDHGPILAQEKINLNGNEFVIDLEQTLAKLGAELLVKLLQNPIASGKKQDESKATYCKKIKKEDGLVNLEEEPPSVLWNKSRAYSSWPRIFFMKNGKRIIITDASLE